MIISDLQYVETASSQVDLKGASRHNSWGDNDSCEREKHRRHHHHHHHHHHRRCHHHHHQGKWDVCSKVVPT